MIRRLVLALFVGFLMFVAGFIVGARTAVRRLARLVYVRMTTQPQDGDSDAEET